MKWRRKWQPTPVFLSGESQGWGSLVGCRLWCRTESDTTERLHFHFSLSRIGEGNGNPLQCSYLENPRDGGAWWATVYGVTQSWTRLKQLSSSKHIFYLLYFCYFLSITYIFTFVFFFLFSKVSHNSCCLLIFLILTSCYSAFCHTPSQIGLEASV